MLGNEEKVVHDGKKNLKANHKKACINWQREALTLIKENNPVQVKEDSCPQLCKKIDKRCITIDTITYIRLALELSCSRSK